MFCAFMLVHYAHVKTPSQYRGIASSEWQSQAKVWYDASYKL